jgi:DNA-binding NarL/FixJ family response regulator
MWAEDSKFEEFHRSNNLVEGLAQVMENKFFLDSSLNGPVLNRLKSVETGWGEKGKADLTRKELEVLKQIVAGNTNREIARSLCFSEHTVRTHVKNLYRKLGVTSRAKTVANALRHKIID